MNRRQAIAGMATTAAGLLVPEHLPSGYLMSQNLTALNNWLNVNSSTTSFNNLLGWQRGINGYWPPQDNWNNLTSAQCNMLAEYTAGMVTHMNSIGLTTLARQVGQANYQANGWVTFVSVG